MRDYSYALITAAKNEQSYIRQILQSVVNQTQLPRIWVIVSDASTDLTDEFVLEFARDYDFIRLLRLNNKGTRAFSRQAFAFNAGYDSIKHMEFDFVGFLDADISLNAGYYETLLGIFKAHPRLGIAGGEILEYHSGRFQPRFGNASDCVAGAIQLFRRQCVEGIGGRFIPLQYGGHDSVAGEMARKTGWEIRSFPGLRVFHHRPTGTAGTALWRARFRQGLEDYFMGYHPLFEFCKCIRRLSEPPFCIGSALQFCAYIYAALTRQDRVVPDEFVRYLRRAQMRRVLQGLLGVSARIPEYGKSIE